MIRLSEFGGSDTVVVVVVRFVGVVSVVGWFRVGGVVSGSLGDC